ncbi:hypothetical protein [Candidatus Nephthysia bennettiae]|uniref:Uncharacterized protein n=1 Tax=Candidatus Nephthysia bennettiae TaxID=3127016 RepID=A0A934K5X9_9BACT|nr:hypothetical protein [Candidatus Dormibacteraeota bacterium]MBJ7614545.1 hypothetical protein [Candidatus Dormibacteraeota bacterium]
MSSDRSERFTLREAERPDLCTQLEAILHQVWEQEAVWRDEDRIDLAARLYRDR